MEDRNTIALLAQVVYAITGTPVQIQSLHIEQSNHREHDHDDQEMLCGGINESGLASSIANHFFGRMFGCNPQDFSPQAS